MKTPTRELLDALPSALVLLSPHGKPAWSNRTFQARYGGTVPPELEPVVAEALARGLPPGGLEVPLREDCSVRVRCAPTPEGLLLILDQGSLCSPPVTVHQRDLLDAVFRTLHAVVMVLDRDGRIVLFNEAAERVSGYSLADLQGRTMLEILVPEDERAAVRDTFARMVSGDPTDCIDCHWVTRDGRRRFLSWSCSVRRGSEGEVEHVIGTAVDRTDLVRISQGLQAVLASDQDAIVTADASGRIMDWNDGAEAMFGYTQAEAVGRSLNLVIPPPGRPEHGRGFRRLAAAGSEGMREAVVQTRGLRRDGTTLPVQVTVSSWGHGPDRRMTAVIRDLSEKHAYEEALREAHRRLRETLDRLIVAQEEERKRIAGDIHDGLLQFVIGADLRLQALSRTMGDSEDLRMAIERLHQAVDEGRRLIRNLRPSTLDDFGLVEALRRELVRLRRETGWEVSFEADLDGASLPPGLETNLFRIIQEALNNALRHSGTTRVGVHLGRSGGEVRARVQDWGRGFDPEAPQGGVGLGIMRERARGLEGWFSVASEPGQGTTVEVGLPLPARKG